MYDKRLSIKNNSSLTPEQRLTPRVYEIVNYAFDHPDLTQKALAQHFGVSEVRISVILRSDKVLAAFPLLARRKIKSLVPKAIKRFGQLMEQNENMEVSRKVSERVLDTEKVLEPETIKVINAVESLTNDELLARIKKSQELGMNVVDAEIVKDPPSTTH